MAKSAQKKKKPKKIENLLPETQRSVLLKKHTTFRVGGFAEYFFIAKNSDDLVRAVIAARELKIPFFILGDGSNLLVSDSGFQGLVIKARNNQYKIEHQKICADSGVAVSVLVKESVKRGLSGLEWAGGLPGTLGGAIRGNAGAFGGEIKDSVVEVEFLDNQNKVRKFSNKNCAFSYRSSIFKKKSFIILSVIIKFQKGDRNKLSKVAKSHIIYRRTKHPLNYPNAGSIFKNCDFKKAPKAIKKRFLSVVKKDPFPIIPTALVILEAGLSGKRVGNAQISKKHSNYIVNLGGAKASDVKKLIKIVKDTVKNKFNLVLEEEIQII
ncbi:MAG: UDP-N-acetylenolpyruvoylglucosamine reductase [Candidatus Wildermuthbacteria bacterium RIFCSPLOWO2_12_FULL_40_9]|uniref:UDP-N-acetylenolpyruvoylglucosamine reductase n=1 Tax=Candidatus Wildermuthbacteria bacterium RIFCSPLOWO2_12_FULL_40_9 TaxID=1802467 RepID=A0A1G2RV91_9BACT|nr:MAG: UDP-N-acetylenolpyruvoylglucosamine reductase [Candidatus Wildermuthbacteria bacterium RIFCSPLOWO2_12_FULL_40_9]